MKGEVILRNHEKDMDISLDAYKTFYYVCEVKNLTKAANLLYVTQPAITKQIKKLEENLGKTLIIRNTRGIELTKEGQLLYNEIKPCIESVINIENTFKYKLDNYEANLKIVAGHTTIKKVFLPAMAKFNKKYPKIKFEMNTYPFSKAIQKLRSNEVDLIVFSEDELTENYNDIIIKDICEIQDILVVSNEIKRKYPDKISVLDLNRFPTISKNQNSSCRNIIEQIFKENGQKFIPTYELSNYWLVDEYIRLGLGIGLLIKEYIKEELQNGTLIEIKTEEQLPKRRKKYAIKKNSAYHEIVREFMKEVTIK